MLQTMLKHKINSHLYLFIRHISSFVEIYIHRYQFIPLCVYKNMQRTLNSLVKTTQLSVRINGTLPNISTLGDEQKSENCRNKTK